MDFCGVKTFCLPIVCAKDRFVTLALFRNVTNSSELKKMAQSGQIDATLLNPKLLCSHFHVLAAVNKAVTRRADDQMKTKTLYSEVIYSLSPSTNISDSFKNFGIQEDSTAIMVVVLSPEREDQKITEVLNKVKGEVSAVENISEVNDITAIRNVYKISEEECAVSYLENSVVTRISIRDVI